MLAIIFFRAIPYAIELLSKECNIDESLKDKTTKSIYIGIMNVVVVTIEFDSWFTLIQTMGDCSSPQLVSAWILWTVMFIVYTTIMGVSGVIGFFNDDDEHNGLFDISFGIVIIVALSIGFGLYLLSDNAQPLDCYPALSDRNRSIMRLSFLLFSSVECVAFIFIAIFCTIRRN